MTGWGSLRWNFLKNEAKCTAPSNKDLPLIGVLGGTATWQSPIPNSFFSGGHLRIEDLEILKRVVWKQGSGGAGL